jgi:uncharacterized protein (DUF433 family)
MAQQRQRTHLEPGDIVIAPGIITNPERRQGEPTMVGSRITVEEVLRKLAAGRSLDDILASWPHLTRRQVLDAIAYAHDLVAQSVTTRTPDDYDLKVGLDDDEDAGEGGQRA